MERLWRYMRPHRRSLLLLVGLNAMTGVVGVLNTLINRRIIDAATEGTAFGSTVLIYIVVVVMALGLSVVSGILGTVVNERFAFGIRLRVYDGVMNACWDRVAAYHSGDVITRLTGDIDIVAGGISETIPSILSLAVSFVTAFVTLAYFDWGIALFALILGPVTALIGLVTGRLMKPLQLKIQETESKYKSYMQESVAGFAVYKAFEAQAAAAAAMAGFREERLRWIFKRQKVSALSSGALSLSFQLGYVVAFIYSVVRMSKRYISFGTMSVFLSLVSQIQGPVIGLSRMLPRIVSIFASTGRIAEMEDLPKEDRLFPALSEAQGVGLKISEVSFGYGTEKIFDHASLEIEAGEFAALTGHSGIGKTTLIRLILAFVRPGAGEIRLIQGDRAPVIDAGARRYISYVPQGNTLLSGTILDNLRMGCRDLTELRAWEILSVVAVDDFVRSTPKGLHTVIGERGLGLSEGQAQRLAIARALAKDAPFLILDEATSALDEETETAVLRHLKEHCQGLTCLLITHRPSTLKYCTTRIKIQNHSLEKETLPPEDLGMLPVDLGAATGQIPAIF